MIVVILENRCIIITWIKFKKNGKKIYIYTDKEETKDE